MGFVGLKGFGRVGIWPRPKDFLAVWPIWPIGQWPMAKIGSQNMIGKLAAAKSAKILSLTALIKRKLIASQLQIKK